MKRKRQPGLIEPEETVEAKGARPLRVFISYSNKDKAFARKLRDSLRLRPEVGIISDDSEMPVAQSWASWFESEVSKTDVFFILLSPNALSSSWVLTEVGAAWAKGIRIIPVVVEPVARMPLELQNVVPLSITDLEDPKTADEMLESILSTVEHSEDKPVKTARCVS
jgi:hypothetical protein